MTPADISSLDCADRAAYEILDALRLRGADPAKVPGLEEVAAIIRTAVEKEREPVGFVCTHCRRHPCPQGVNDGQSDSDGRRGEGSV